MKKKSSGKNPVLADIKFAYRHLNTPEDEVPTPKRQEARNMLSWARNHTKEFMALLIRTAKDEDNSESRGTKDIGTEEALAIVSELLSEYNLAEEVKRDDTPRHEKVRMLRDQGFGTGAIATKLGVTTRTVQKDYKVLELLDENAKGDEAESGGQAAPPKAG